MEVEIVCSLANNEQMSDVYMRIILHAGQPEIMVFTRRLAFLSNTCKGMLIKVYICISN